MFASFFGVIFFVHIIIILIFHSGSYNFFLFLFRFDYFYRIARISDDSFLCEIPRIEVDHHFNNKTKIEQKERKIRIKQAFGRLLLLLFFCVIRHAPYYGSTFTWCLCCLCAFILWVYRTNVFLLSCYKWRPTELQTMH